MPNTVTVCDTILYRKQCDLIYICIFWSSLDARLSLAPRFLVITVPNPLSGNENIYLTSELETVLDRWYLSAVSCHLPEGIWFECERTSFEACCRKSKWNDWRSRGVGSKFSKYLTIPAYIKEPLIM